MPSDFEKFLKSQKRVTAYYGYPTAFSSAPGKLLVATDDQHDGPDLIIKSIVDLFLAIGQALALVNNDNKIAVRVEVDDFDFDVYCCRNDGRWVITKELLSTGSISELRSNTIE